MPEHATSSSLATKREMFLKLNKQKEINERITPRDKRGRVPVSYMQLKMLNAVIKKLYDPEKTQTLCPSISYLIKGSVHISAFHRAIQEIVKRHEILRTSYEVIDSQPYQVVNDVPDNILKVVDLNNLKEDERKAEVDRITMNRALETFSFFKDPLMIMATLITAENEHVLYIPTHHIATDGISIKILQQELLTLFQLYLLNMNTPLPELPLQYGDFAFWERERYSGDFLEKKLAYWKQLPDKINSFLPVDNTPETLSYDGENVPIVILPALTRKLKSLSQECNVTLFTLLFTAFMELIYIFSGCKYNFFSFIVANRPQKETEMLIGCFMNYQFLHIDFKGNPTFMEVIERTNKALLEVYDNYVPYHVISKTIPLLGSIVNFQLQSFWKGAAKASEPMPKESDTETKSDTEDIDSIPQTKSNESIQNLITQPIMFIPYKIKQQPFAIFPFEVMLSEIADTINGTFTYNASLYNRCTIINLTNDYIIFLSQILKNPQTRISEINLKPHKSLIL